MSSPPDCAEVDAVLRYRRLVLSVLATVTVSALAPSGAGASELIGKNASAVALAVSADGVAQVSFRSGGAARTVRASGAIDARHPSPKAAQVAFRLETSGAGVVKNACRPYNGPPLHWLVAACTAPDGSYWAVQSWQRLLPNYGVAPSAELAVSELRLSHWRGAPAVLEIKLDWAYRRYEHLYGTLMYQGKPVHGFKTTRFGAPLDTYGRNIYVDTFNSAYGRGWKRENSFVANKPRGNFCYGFYPHAGRPPGHGAAYRATVIGPGVTPDVYWEGTALGPYDPVADQAANAEQRKLGCKPT